MAGGKRLAAAWKVDAKELRIMTRNEIVVGLNDSSLRCAGSFDAEDSRSRSTNTTSITEITHSLTRPQRAIDNDEPNRICRGPLESRPRTGRRPQSW